MPHKQEFIEWVEKVRLIEEMPDGAYNFYKDFKNTVMNSTKFTKNGIAVLECLRSSTDKFNSAFTAKELGEKMNIDTKIIAAIVRKLTRDGYIEIIKKNTHGSAVYRITGLGKTVELIY